MTLAMDTPPFFTFVGLFLLFSLAKRFLTSCFHENMYSTAKKVYNTANSRNNQTHSRCHARNDLVYKNVMYTNNPATASKKNMTNAPSNPTWVQKLNSTFLPCFFFVDGVLVTVVSSISFGVARASGVSIINYVPPGFLSVQTYIPVSSFGLFTILEVRPNLKQTFVQINLRPRLSIATFFVIKVLS